MITPDFSAFKAFSSSANIIPISRELMVDYDTPVSLFAKVGEGRDHAFLLESLQGGEKWGRYSFIGLNPMLIFGFQGNEVFTEVKESKKQFFASNPLDAFKDIMKEFVSAQVEGLPRFYGGAVGYLGYDMVRFMERLPDDLKNTAGFHDSVFMIPELLLVCDNIKQRLNIIYCAKVDDKIDAETAYEKGLEDIEEIVQKIRKGIDYPEIFNNQGPITSLSPEVPEDQFKKIVQRAKEYIKAGDVIQVVLSQRFSGKNHIPPFELYKALRRINPSPYLYYIHLNDETLIGSSPEILVRLTGKDIELRPIAGTRPRGKDQAEDLMLEKDLLSDPKERAEHLMLVDLGRNDVGRVAKTGSVKVKDFMTVERYSHVMHIVSGVTGKLEDDKDMFDLLNACFPAGTVTGAPKIRAMEIIEELEHSRRGPYAGAVGYFGFSGNMDLAITIRTLCQKGENLYLQAGAGIVADSVPEKEWEETLNKGKALMRAINAAQNR